MGLAPASKRLAQHKPGLGLRAVHGVHDEQHAVDHVHDPLDFPAEIRVAGGVHDVHVVVLVFEGGVFGADGDALLALEVHGIHQPLLRAFVLVRPKGARLLQQAIHQGGLAVIDVGDNRYVPNMLHKS